MKKLTTEQFISKAIDKHGDLYDYSESVYINAHTKVKIKCKIHGVFEQTPSAHQSGQGCPDCNSVLPYGEAGFVVRAIEKHGTRYDYSNCNYINDKSYVSIICPVHGTFKQTAGSHLSGKGCSQCHLENKAHDTPSFIKKARLVHGDYYDYSNVEYINAKKKVTIICPEHGEFTQTSNDHLCGKGCRQCGLKRLNGAYNDTFFVKFPELKTTECILYMLKITHSETNEVFWKVGVTTLASVQKRYSADYRGHIFEVVAQQVRPLFEAYTIEQQLIQEHKQFKYDPLHFKGGHTECFSIPITLPQ